MRAASITLSSSGFQSSGDLPFSIYSDSTKTTQLPNYSSAFASATEVYIDLRGECFRFAIPHVPVGIEVEFFDHLGVSKGCLRDLQANDSGLEWSNVFFSLRVKTSAGLGTSLLEIWSFANG